MDNRQEAARNFEEYINYNHTSVYYTYKMEYEVINDIKQNRKNNILKIETSDKLIDYLEKLVLNNFSMSLTKDEKLERKYNFYNQNDIDENTINYLETRNGEDFSTAVIKNIYDKYGNNFLYHVDNYYKDDNTWKTVMLDFYNTFINKLLSGNHELYNYRVSAVFYTLDSTDGISVMISELSNLNEYDEYKIFKKLNEDHKSRVDSINNLKGFN